MGACYNKCMGRPKLPPSEKRDSHYPVKVNERERQQAQSLSAKTGMSVAELYREGLFLMEKKVNEGHGGR